MRVLRDMEIVNRQPLLSWFDDQDEPLLAALVTHTIPESE